MPVSAELQALACNTYYSEGVDYKGADKYAGQDLEAWVAPVGCVTGLPKQYDLTVGAVTLGDENVSISLEAGEADTTIYKGDVVWLPGQQALLVIAADTVLTDAGATVPIFPAEKTATSVTAYSYLMKPLLSFEEGWLPNTSGSEASSRNRGQSPFSSKIIVGRDYSMSASGGAVKNDPGLVVLENVKNTTKQVFFNSRMRPFQSFGISPFSSFGTCFVNSSSPSAAASDFIKVSYELMGDGKPNVYLPLGMVLATAKTLLTDDAFVQGLPD